MKLLLFGTAGYLDGAAGGPARPVAPAISPNRIREAIHERNSYGPVIAVGSVIALFLIANPAAADPYKWCANYRNGGACGFTTFEQCYNGQRSRRVLRAKPVLYRPDKTSAQRSQKQAHANLL
jgi:hypothetical protein